MILVTGGCGFIGSHLVDHLIDHGEDVTIIDSLYTGNHINHRANFIPNRVEDFDFRKMKKPEVIFHLAARARIQPSFLEPLDTYESNSLSTMRVLEFARRHNTKVVLAGSSSVEHNVYANPYSYTKFLQEEHCRLYHRVYGLSIGIARFFNVYGPRQIEDGAYATVIGIFERLKREGKPLTVTGTGEQRRDFTHVSDIVSGLIALSEKSTGEEVFNFGTGKNYSINEVVRMFGGEIEHIPARSGEAWETLADISRSRHVLGYAPRYSLEDYIKDTREINKRC